MESLNERIYTQQQQFDKPENLIAAMAERIRIRDAAQAPINERPPHY